MVLSQYLHMGSTQLEVDESVDRSSVTRAPSNPSPPRRNIPSESQYSVERFNTRVSNSNEHPLNGNLPSVEEGARKLSSSRQSRSYSLDNLNEYANQHAGSDADHALSDYMNEMFVMTPKNERKPMQPNDEYPYSYASARDFSPQPNDNNAGYEVVNDNPIRQVKRNPRPLTQSLSNPNLVDGNLDMKRQSQGKPIKLFYIDNKLPKPSGQPQSERSSLDNRAPIVDTNRNVSVQANTVSVESAAKIITPIKGINMTPKTRMFTKQKSVSQIETSLSSSATFSNNKH